MEYYSKDGHTITKHSVIAYDEIEDIIGTEYGNGNDKGSFVATNSFGTSS